MARLYTNNYKTTLNGAISNSDTSIVVTSVAALPAVGAGDTCILTLDDGSNIEIIECTANSGTTLTVVRAQEGTSGTAFADGTPIELRVTAASFGASLSVATQTEQETATSTTVAVAPGVQQYHPSACKGWVKCGITGNIVVSYNVTSVTDTGTGAITVNWDTDFSSADYSVVAMVESSSLNNFMLRISSASPPAAGTTLIRMEDNGASTDPVKWYVAAFGDQ